MRQIQPRDIACDLLRIAYESASTQANEAIGTPCRVPCDGAADGCQSIIEVTRKDPKREIVRASRDTVCIFGGSNEPPGPETITLFGEKFSGAKSIPPEDAALIAGTVRDVLDKDRKKAFPSCSSLPRAWEEIQKALRGVEKAEKRTERLLDETQALVVVWNGEQEGTILVGNHDSITPTTIAQAADNMYLFHNENSRYYVVCLDKKPG